MLGQEFYHDLFRKSVIIFGNLFNDIRVYRVDTSSNLVQTIAVPIEYAERDKMIVRINENPQLSVPVSTQLPRMSFEIVSWQYKPEQQYAKLRKRTNTIKDDEDRRYTHYVPQPVILGFQLNIYAKFAYDAFQIVEQITPFFNPEWNVTANLIGDMNKLDNVKVVLRSVNKRDPYDLQFGTQRLINWTLAFDMHTFFFGPVHKSGIIKRVQVDYHVVKGDGTITGTEMGESPREIRYVLVPGLTVDGKPTSNAENSISYRLINATDDYGFIETITEYDDGLVYDPVTGRDKEIGS